MKIKRKNLIIIYLFTAAVFITGLWRFSENEKVYVLENDYDRLSNIAAIVDDIYYLESANCFSATVFARLYANSLHSPTTKLSNLNLKLRFEFD